jgi:hypothetical protein
VDLAVDAAHINPPEGADLTEPRAGARQRQGDRIVAADVRVRSQLGPGRSSISAREHLTTATGMYSEMGMPFWLKQADAAMAGLA